MTIKDRILEYLKYKKLPVKQFEERSGLSNGYVSSMRKGIGLEKLENVLNAFPDLDRDWLIYGEGQMIKNLEESSNLEDTNLNSNAMSENHLQKLFEMLESQQRVIASMAESNKQLAEANQIQAQSFQSLIQKLQIEEAPDENTNTSEGVKKSQAS